MRRLIAGLKIRQKIFISFMLLISFCLFTTLYMTSTRVTDVIRDKTINYSRQLVSKTMENIEYYLLDTRYMAKNIALDEQVNHKVLELSEQKAAADYRSKGQLDALLNKYKYLKTYITDITLVDDNGSGLGIYNLAYDDKYPIAEQAWYQHFRNSGAESMFSGVHKSIVRDTSMSSLDTFTFFQKVYDAERPTRYLYTIAIELDARVISDALAQVNSNQGWINRVYNVDNEPMNGKEDSSIPDSGDIPGQFDGKSSRIITVGGDKYTLLQSGSKDYGWHIMSLVPQKAIMSEANSIQLYIVIIGLILLLFAVYLSNRISKDITRPLMHLMKAIREIERGNFDIQSNVNTGDEIKELNDVIQSMAVNIKGLLVRNKEEEQAKRKAELTALQAQINPHFLYNTLESLNWYAVRKKEPEISEVITNLGKFFRISLSKGSKFITIEQEIEHAKSYLNIQKFRNSNRFESSIRTEGISMEQYTPKLILQPILENALIHGLRNRESPGRIDIRLEQEEEALLFIVSDDGVGISADKLAEIRSALGGTKAAGTGFYGLKNVNERISLYFGSSYGIHLSSPASGGTEVRIRIPILTEQPGD
ncbi:cache domain-containing sensor histidine kinase [Paenibacillus sedimenti]|uniref:histidine kinase n=1 Tax=Paenibacillus sedimenti TaxID=2770274 RepID=A0A926KK32_9BACL|nr:sensor histidine kinase [Paenibacillus sedimenti]MBD0378543.1 sensor histidine kinase [Paenibacillus sedimenti]